MKSYMKDRNPLLDTERYSCTDKIPLHYFDAELGATAQSRLIRWNGAFSLKDNVTLAQHSVAVSLAMEILGFPSSVQLAALLHDMEEVKTGDFPASTKKIFVNREEADRLSKKVMHLYAVSKTFDSYHDEISRIDKLSYRVELIIRQGADPVADIGESYAQFTDEEKTAVLRAYKMTEAPWWCKALMGLTDHYCNFHKQQFKDRIKYLRGYI